MNTPTTREQDEAFMRLALNKARWGVQEGQTPFGACIVDAQGQVVTCEHNRVWSELDPTAHAEVTAVRLACQPRKTIALGGCTIYSTTEPCPMCFAAIHWARISRIVYAATIAAARAAGFNEMNLSNEQFKELAGLSVEIVAGVLAGDGVSLFEEWKRHGGKAY